MTAVKRSLRRSGGFTLLELLIALSILGVLLAITFGGLRVAISSWTRGEERAEIQQHARGIAQIVGRAIGAAYPYRGPLGQGLDKDKPVLFIGADSRIEMVTQAAPFPAEIPAAFTAVVIGIEDDAQGRALVIRQRIMPNREPFTAAVVVLRDPLIQKIELRYLGAEETWMESWDGDAEQKLPAAIAIRFSAQRQGRLEALPPMTISLRTTTIQ